MKKKVFKFDEHPKTIKFRDTNKLIAERGRKREVKANQLIDQCNTLKDKIKK